MESGLSITIAVLAYNEAENLTTVVREVDAALEALPASHEIVIVNDGSTDDTRTVAEQLASEMARVRVVTHPVNLGLGGGYRTGFKEAKGDLLTFWPADGQFDPSIIGRFAAAIQGYDLVLGYLPNHQRGLVAATLSMGERLLYTALFGKLPRFQGVLMLRTTLLNDVELVSDGRGWAVIIEFIIRVVQLGKRTRSVATSLRPRQGGASKVMNLETIYSNLKQILQLRLKI